MIENTGVWVGTLLTILATIVGLVVWLVKWSEKRQSAVTDRYFTHLEKRAEVDDARYKKQWDLLDQQTKALSQNTEELKALALAVSRCQTPRAHSAKPDQEVERHW